MSRVDGNRNQKAASKNDAIKQNAFVWVKFKLWVCELARICMVNMHVIATAFKLKCKVHVYCTDIAPSWFMNSFWYVLWKVKYWWQSMVVSTCKSKNNKDLKTVCRFAVINFRSKSHCFASGTLANECKISNGVNLSKCLLLLLHWRCSNFANIGFRCTAGPKCVCRWSSGGKNTNGSDYNDDDNHQQGCLCFCVHRTSDAYSHAYSRAIMHTNQRHGSDRRKQTLALVFGKNYKV